MKHKLKIEELAVDTFATAEGAAEARGTVRGLQESYPYVCGPTAIEDTCAEDCHPSLEISCAGGTCAECPFTQSLDCA